MNRKAQVVVERERGEDNDSNDDFDNDNIGKAEAVASNECNEATLTKMNGGRIIYCKYFK